MSDADNSGAEAKVLSKRKPGKPFQKGESGNPGGRPKALVEVVEAARAHTVNAITTLATIMGDEATAAPARVAAATVLLDRGWGKPTQPISDPEGGPAIRFVLLGAVEAVSSEAWESAASAPGAEPAP